MYMKEEVSVILILYYISYLGKTICFKLCLISINKHGDRRLNNFPVKFEPGGHSASYETSYEDPLRHSGLYVDKFAYIMIK